jgi:mannosyltransferase
MAFNPPQITPRVRVMLNLLSAAVVFRLLRLDDLSLWADEGVTWWNAVHGTVKDAIFAESNHPPVWWLVTRAWVGTHPGGETSLRMPAAILGAVSVWMTFFLARRLFDPAWAPSRGGFVGTDRTAPLWAAGLAAGSGFLLEVSQEARMYAALLAESLGLSLLYLRWLDRGQRWTLVAYAALAALALHTQYFAVWPILAHAAHALYVTRVERRAGRAFSPRPLFVAQAVAALLFVPWFLHMAGAYRGISTGTYDPFGRLLHALWRMGVGPGLVPLDRPRVEAGPAAVFRESWPVIVVTAVLWMVPIAAGVRALRRDRGAFSFLLASVAVPIACVLLVFPKFPLIHEKYLVFLAPPLLLLAVAGARLARPGLRAAMLAGLVVLTVASLVGYHAGFVPDVRDVLNQGHVYGKEQWREAHEWVKARRQPGDVVLIHAPFLVKTWDFYDQDHTAPATRVPPADLPSDRALSGEELLARVPGIRSARRIFVVLSHEETEPRDAYRGAAFEAAQAVWSGPLHVEAKVFDLQWGIRVFVLERGDG